ncbi:MAG: GNAT family N-acetyltransferase [Endozoicomonas sp.]|uniref:GNAT family N-acetyltransferase n=1 Tax=Endozoicomonas sp. TaxID=1892382 RepID=UPI003D9AEDBA
MNKQWHSENIKVSTFSEHEIPLLKTIFEQNASVSERDPSFGVWSMDVYQSIYEEHQKDHFFLRKIMDSDDRAAGYFHCNYHQARKGVCWISMLSISPEFQGKQLGRHTFESIEQQVRSIPGIQEFWLEVYTRNQAALHFWVRQGFNRIVKVRDETVEGDTLSSMILSKSVA